MNMNGKNVADADGALRGVNHISTPQKQRAQDPPAIHGIRRQQVEQAKVEVRPDDAPQQGARMKQRPRGKRKVRHSRE